MSGKSKVKVAMHHCCQSVGPPICRYINNQKELYSFMFDGVLPHNCKQDEVWQQRFYPSAREGPCKGAWSCAVLQHDMSTDKPRDV